MVPSDQPAALLVYEKVSYAYLVGAQAIFLYTVVMRILFILLAFSSVASAQDCDSALAAGAANMELTVSAAQKEKWDASAYYSNDAFVALLDAAFTYCEGEKQEFAHQQLVELRKIDVQVNCAYHSTFANVASIRSKLAFERLDDPHQALRHAEDSAFYIDEALKWCKYAPEKMEAIQGAKESMIIVIKQIKNYIEEFGVEESSGVEFNMKFKLEHGH